MNKRILSAGIILILIVGLLVVSELAGLTHFIKKTPPVSNDSEAGLTNEQKQAASKIEAESKQKAIEDTNNGGGPTTNSIEMSAQQENNGTVTVFTKLFGFSDGNCNLSVTNNSKQSAQSAPVIFQPEYSSCAGFSVPVANLGNGIWSLSLSVVSNGKTYSKNISFEVK